MSAVETERRDDLAVVRLNRPDAFNAIDPELADELFDALGRFGGDDAIRAVVLTGAGKAFCSGGDLRTIWKQSERDPEAVFYDLAGAFHEAILQLKRMPKAVVAALNGPAAGGGFSLALACDLRVIDPDAYLKVGYTDAGLSMDGGGSHALPRIVGLGRAMELVALEKRVKARRAEEIGLVNEVAASNGVVETAFEMADRAADGSRAAFARSKALMHRSFDRSLERQLQDERETIAEVAQTPEGREGIEAFLEKRDAEFRDL